MAQIIRLRGLHTMVRKLVKETGYPLLGTHYCLLSTLKTRADESGTSQNCLWWGPEEGSQGMPEHHLSGGDLIGPGREIFSYSVL